MKRQQIFPLFVVVTLLLMFLTGCAATPAAPVAESPPATSLSAATEAAETPQPASPVSAEESHWTGIWGSSGSDVFITGYGSKHPKSHVVGLPGVIMHYDGSGWSPVDNPPTNWISNLWGSSGSDVFFFVEGARSFLHYDGSAWSEMSSGTNFDLSGMWGSAEDDIFAVGGAGAIMRYDGAVWSPMESGTYINLWGVWGSSNSNVYAVGSGGAILHFDGNVWSPVDSGVTRDLWSVWGSSDHDVFAVGADGTITHFDGSAWSPMDSKMTKDLNSVWGSSNTDVFAVGDKSAILHYDGSAWSPMNSGGANYLGAVWGSSGNDVFAVGDENTILHYDGSVWWDMNSGTPAATPVAASSSLTPTTSLDSALVSKIETAIQETMKYAQLPGLAIAIIKDGQVVYTKGFGLAEVDTDRVTTPETVFQLGSVSKMMVGIALMQLKEQGKIDLDAPVTTYLPYFQLASEWDKDITIRQLLSHRSGLTFTTGYLEDYLSPEYDEGSLERHVRDLAHLKMGSLPPGARMQYSDIGFEILGDVIAKVSGQSFEVYTQEHIFAPLGMKHTTFLLEDVPPELLAAPHEFGGSEARVLSFFPYSRQHAPSSNLFSNVDDMSRYALAQLAQGQGEGTAILPAAAYEEMWTAQGETNLPSPWEKDVGLGWFLGNQEGHRLVGHGGMDKGFGCGFIMAPDDGLAVIVMVNRDYLAEEFSYKVMDWLLEPPLTP